MPLFSCASAVLRKRRPADETHSCSSDEESTNNMGKTFQFPSATCIKEGLLQQHIGALHRAKCKYYKLYPQLLFYARHKNASAFKEIDLSQMSVAETGSDNVRNVFKVITNKCTLVLNAEDRKEMEDWIRSFKLASNSIAQSLDSAAHGRNLSAAGLHHWYSCMHSRPTYCNVCRGLLPGVTGKGLSCEVCRFKVHKHCASRTTENCKWTTLDSIPIEDRLTGLLGDPLAMPHQWVEGNVSPSMRCSVCWKTCGSKRRLLDWSCLWCDTVVHTACKHQLDKKCTLGPNHLSIIPPTAMRQCNQYDGIEMNDIRYPRRKSPLLVFVNSKSGDNQGIRFMRRFRQLLNPAQVFDLSTAGPSQGLEMCRNFEHFRILVCGGDGSIGWVMTEVDKKGLNNQCQIGVLPLGTGNDLARILGWGSTCYDVSVIPVVLQQLEKARPEMLDRWSIFIKEFPSAETAKGDSMLGYEDSIAMHLTRILTSNQHHVAIDSARILCETIRNFVSEVGRLSSSVVEEDADAAATTERCSKLEEKLGLLLRTLQVESRNSSNSRKARALASKRRNSSTNEDVSQLPLDAPESFAGCRMSSSKWHSDSELEIDESAADKRTGRKQKRKPKVFIPKDHLWSRVSSLKKAMRDIISHTERALDEQNLNDGEGSPFEVVAGDRDPFENNHMTNPSNVGKPSEATTTTSDSSYLHLTRPTQDSHNRVDFSTLPDDVASSNSQLSFSPHRLCKSPSLQVINERASQQSNHRLIDRRRSASQGSIPWSSHQQQKRQNKPKCPSRSVSVGAASGSTAALKPDFLLAYKKTSNTVVYPGTVIAKAFIKETVTEGFIGRALLANANALCAAAMPELDQEENIGTFDEKCAMNNYFGIGIDAKVSLDFHMKREEHPEKCRSRRKNMIWYGVLGGMEIVNRTYRNLDQNVHLECDGHKITLPSLQGIVILNIPSYMGGSNFWGTKKEVDGFCIPSTDDKMLEVVAVLGASQMGMSKVFGGMQHQRIAQCHTVKITITDEPVPVQVDGEAWMQDPGLIRIVHKNRAPMLVRDREFEVALRSWNELQQVKTERHEAVVVEDEMCLLRPLSIAFLSLIRSIKAASMICSDVERELYDRAVAMASLTDSIFPPTDANEVVQRFQVEDFTGQAKSFIDEVNERLWTLKPRLSSDLESRIVSALSAADREMSAYTEYRLLSATKHEEETRGSVSSTSKKTKASSGGWFKKGSPSKEKHSSIGNSPIEDVLNTKDVSDWGVAEVGMWLDGIGCSDHKEAFRLHDIRGPELTALDRRDLQAIGVTKVGHVKRILEKARLVQLAVKQGKPVKI